MLCASDGFSPVLTAASSSSSFLQNFAVQKRLDVMTKTKRITNMIQKVLFGRRMPPVPTAAFSSCRVTVQQHTGETLSEEIVTFFITLSHQYIYNLNILQLYTFLIFLVGYFNFSLAFLFLILAGYQCSSTLLRHFIRKLSHFSSHFHINIYTIST